MQWQKHKLWSNPNPAEILVCTNLNILANFEFFKLLSKNTDKVCDWIIEKKLIAYQTAKGMIAMKYKLVLT